MHDLDQIIWFGPGRMCLWLVGIITHGLILTSATKWADYTQGPRRPIAGYSEHATLTRARPTPFQRLSSVFWMEKGFNLLGDRCVLYFKTCMNETKLFWTWFWASSWMNIASGIVGVICRIRASIVSGCCCCCRKTVALYETSSIVSGGGLWLQRALLWAWTTPWPLGLNYIALGFGAIKRMSTIVIKCPCN